ncbi:LysR family transcriptional regulator [soil metagenome]
MIKLEGVETFLTIAEQGSLSEAARALGVSRSVVSDRLAELERELDTRLIQRTTRRLTLTEDGKAFLARGKRICQEITDATAEIAERQGELRGPLRLSAPVSFGVLHLGPALYPFLALHAGIQLSLDLDDRFVDAEADGYDAVIRHGPVRDNWLVAIRLAPSARMLVASPAYIEARGRPTGVADLHDHRAILYTNRAVDWRFSGPDGDAIVRPRHAMRVNSGIVMRDAAVAGLGIALLPSFLIHAELSDGRLNRIDVGLEPESAEVHLAYSKAQPPSTKLRALIDHLQTTFESQPWTR